MVSRFGKSLVAAAALAIAISSSVHAQDKLKVIVFPGLSNLAQFAAESQGFYKKRNLAVEIIYTPNSTELRTGLAAGRYDIAHGGVDNAVAQVENDKTDLFIFMGGNSGLNSLYVQPEIKSYEQLRGTTMAVDAPNTAFALLLYKMLDVKGIKRSDYKVQPVGATHLRLAAMLKDKTYSAAMLSPPSSSRRTKTASRISARRSAWSGRISPTAAGCCASARPTPTRSRATSRPMSRASAGRSIPRTAPNWSRSPPDG